LLHRRPRKLPHGGFVEETMGLEVAQQRDGEGWVEKRRESRAATYACHVITGHGFRPVWTCRLQ
jgi:hypothetical protein